MWETHTCLPWLWTDKTRTEWKCSRQRSTWTWWVCSCTCHACARVCVKIWAVSQSSDLTASIIASFLSRCSPSTWQALVCSFSCFSLPKEEASCGTCFFLRLIYLLHIWKSWHNLAGAHNRAKFWLMEGRVGWMASIVLCWVCCTPKMTHLVTMFNRTWFFR